MVYHEIAESAWNSLQGVILDGGYELKDALELTDCAAAFRVRILGSGGREGIAHFLQLNSKDAADQIDIWETLREIRHPNLAPPMAIGRHYVSGAEAIYVVMADPDEKLISIIPERPIEWEEAAELLSSVERGLSHLHSYGLVHGCVSPETVGAVGYTIQLSTECVRRINRTPIVPIVKPRYLAPESVGENTSTQADVWCLGATLFEVLSQRQYGSAGAVLSEGLPLGAVIKRCLETDPRTRCTLNEAPGLEVKAPAAATPPVSPIAKPEIRTAAAVVDIPEAAKPKPAVNDPPRVTPAFEKQRAQQTAARTVTAEEMILVPMGKRQRGVKRQAIGARIKTVYQPIMETAEDPQPSADAPAFSGVVRVGPKPGVWRNVLVASVAAVAVIAAVWLIIIPRLQSPVEHAQTQEQSGPTATSAKPEAPVPAPVPVATLNAEPDGKWRVVLYSYAHSSDAERRVQLILSNHPGVQAHVYSPKPDGPYLVVTGEAMSRTKADEVRDRMVELGMPKTTRVESFNE